MNYLATADPAGLQSAADALWRWIGEALLCGTLLASVTWLVLRALGHRMRPALHGCLWFIVLIKFIVPFGPAWTFSLASTTLLLTRAWPAAPAATTPAPAEPKRADSSVVVATFVDQIPAEAANPAIIASRWSAKALLAGGYLATMLAVAMVRLASYWRFRARCRRLPRAEADTLEVVRRLCQRVGVRRVPNVAISDSAPAPFIFGFLRPMLILSRRQLVRPDELEAVILHEVAHLRRGDLLVRHLQWLAGTVLFFWPVVAWVNRRIDLARECACDEWALRHGRLSAEDYARLLLDALRPVRSRWGAYRPAAMALHARTVERRIEMIMQTPKSRRLRGLGVAAVVLTLAWAGFALTGAASADDAAPPQTADLPIASEGVRVFVTSYDVNVNDVQIETIDCDPIDVVIPEISEESLDPSGATETRTMRVVVRKHADGLPGAGEKVHVVLPFEEQLSEFATAHPTADANNDGQVSMTERDAFLAARVLGAPAAALAQFPRADRDGNGRLDADEAVRLVSSGMFLRTEVRGPAGASVALPGGATPRRVEMRVARAARFSSDADGEKPMSGALPAGPRGAAKWVLENINVEPTVASVAALVPTVEELPNRELLAHSPEADTNGDGKLSSDERDAFFKQQEAKMNARLLAKHPEADLNGDGVLTMDELAQFHLAKSGGGVSATAVGDGERKMIIMSVDSETKVGPGSPDDDK